VSSDHSEVEEGHNIKNTQQAHHDHPTKDSKSDLVRQYRLVPVAEHPIFPGASTALSVTDEQF